ncbi:MAG: nuclear transport factor 2 family protein [Rhodospirillales bacterium]|nr:nuclear transport factor 2 family protein [Rhodospirillales bacterium]
MEKRDAHGADDDIVARVERFIELSMAGDPASNAFIAPNVEITFTGGRRFAAPREIGAFNATRYRWVKKKIAGFDIAPGAKETVVYCHGTLYGEWPDGTPFEGNRFVDRMVFADGRIVKTDVWNDSAEILLQRR